MAEIWASDSWVIGQRVATVAAVVAPLQKEAVVQVRDPNTL